MKKIILFTLIVFSFSSVAQNITTKGTEFWLTYMENLTLNFNGPPSFSIIISSDVNTSGTVAIPATGFTIPFSVTANQATEVLLPANIYYPEGDEDYFDFGIKITSAAPVNVYTYHFRAFFTDATVVLPLTELSDQYLIMAHTDFSVNSPSEFVVEATQDSTVIEIIPSVVTVSFRPPGVPFTIVLNEGQVFQLQSYEDLTGSSVRSLDPQKKIAVFGGARQANIYCSGADNTLYDEIYPETSAGSNFITVPFLTFSQQGYDFFRFMATADSTAFTINSAPVFLLHRGEYYDTLLSAAAYIVSNKPIFATQFKTSQNCSMGSLGDPSMLNLTPLNLKKKTSIFKSLDGPPPTSMLNPHHYINIITATNSTGLLTLDGNPVAGFIPVPAYPAFSYAVSSLIQGQHIIESDSGFNAYAYGIGMANAYTFHLGYDNFLSTGTGESDKNQIDLLIANPVKDKIQIGGILFLKNLKIKMYDIPGHTMFQKNFINVSGTIEIDVSGYSK